MLVLVVDSSTPAVTAALAKVTTAKVTTAKVTTAEATTAKVTTAEATTAKVTTDAAMGTVATVTAGGAVVLACRRTVDARAHGELLAPHIEGVLAEAGARVGDLGAIVAGLGPGPFTGLRVGLVTAASMGQILGIPAYGVCSLDAIGWAVGQERVLVATDARRREVYWGGYDGGKPVTAPGVDAPAAVAGRAAELGLAVAVGDGALRYADVLGLPVRDEPRYPPAEGLIALAADRIRSGAPGERLTPLYLRRPDAVEPGARKAVLTP